MNYKQFCPFTWILYNGSFLKSSTKIWSASSKLETKSSQFFHIILQLKKINWRFCECKFNNCKCCGNECPLNIYEPENLQIYCNWKSWCDGFCKNFGTFLEDYMNPLERFQNLSFEIIHGIGMCNFFEM
jgi:hypothetical protein